MDELKCKVCGKLAQDDPHFYKNSHLCNRHALQLKNHGHFLDNKLIINQSRTFWTDEEKKELEVLIAEGRTIAEAAKILNRNIAATQTMSSKLGLGDKYTKKNSAKFKAIYQDYDWFFDCYINKGMTLQEIADASGASLRVIQKWADEKHHINSKTYKNLKRLSTLQRQIIIAGTIGDGHIDKRIDQPMYIETHAENEKEYLFWKYEQLKDLCNKEPVYYPAQNHSFGGEKEYACQPHYRLNSRIIMELAEIRSMSRLEKIQSLNMFQICLLLLDDGSRGNLWQLCVASWQQSEIDLFIKRCKEKFLIRARQNKDIRYISFDALSSKRIDQAILDCLPPDLDIIKKKITNNPQIKEFKDSKYILCEGEKVGIGRYCKMHHLQYESVKEYIEILNLPFNEIEEADFIKGYKKVD